MIHGGGRPFFPNAERRSRNNSREFFPWAGFVPYRMNRITLAVGFFALYVMVGFEFARADAPPASVYDVVFIGDSITFGIGTPDPGTQAAPVIAAHDLQLMLGAGTAVYFSNQGHNGHTTVDFLPGGADFKGAEGAAKQLEADHPGQLLFSIMLGTNDCSSNGVTTGSPVSAAHYAQNLQKIIDALLSDYPGCKFVINHPIWFSPNTHNAADYTGSACADRVKSYFPAIAALVDSYSLPHANQVYVGDTDAYDYFSIHFQTELNGENGTFGIFFLHPNPTGAKSLGKFWATAIAKVLKS
jgi:lysophospholipase L1-like esterase